MDVIMHYAPFCLFIAPFSENRIRRFSEMVFIFYPFLVFDHFLSKSAFSGRFKAESRIFWQFFGSNSWPGKRFPDVFEGPDYIRLV